MSYDYVICAHKALQQDAAVGDIQPLIKPQTTIVIAQNGVGNEDPFRERYPENSIISCAVSTQLTLLSPWELYSISIAGLDRSGPIQTGRVFYPQQRAYGSRVVPKLATRRYTGTSPRRDICGHFERRRAQRFARRKHPDQKMGEARLQHLWNPVSALTQQNMGVPFFDSSEESEAFGKALMLDVIAIARKSGVPLDDSLADKYLAFTKSAGSFQPSMLHDLNAGIPLEIDVIVGAPMRKARQLKMEVPSLRAVFALVSALNGKLTLGRDSS